MSARRSNYKSSSGIHSKSIIITRTADKSGDCTFMASWIKCLMDNVPAFYDVFIKRFYDNQNVNLTIIYI
jgi:hypothetical protein